MRPVIMLFALATSVAVLPGCAAKRLQTELTTAQSDLDQCRSDLAAARASVKTEKTAKELAEQRVRAYRELAEKLRAAFGDQGLDIVIRQGRLVVQLPNAILFESGKRTLTAEGQASLRKLAKVLKTVPDRRFLVAGHTDNVAITAKTTAFKSNWELSTLRATTAVEFLVSEGVKPTQLGAAGYGEFLPDSSNDTEAGRSKNRRLEIIVMPRADEIPPMPAAL